MSQFQDRFEYPSTEASLEVVEEEPFQVFPLRERLPNDRHHAPDRYRTHSDDDVDLPPRDSNNESAPISAGDHLHNHRHNGKWMDDSVAERILDTLKKKDEFIEELQHSVECLQLENDRLRREVDDCQLSRHTLLSQYTAVMKDVGDKERTETESAELKKQVAVLTKERDELSRALRLQMDALSEQSRQFEEKSSAQLEQLRQLELKVANSKFKNEKLLDELKRLATESDLRSEEHAAAAQLNKEKQDQLESRIGEMQTRLEDHRALEVKLTFAEQANSSKEEQIVDLKRELSVAMLELQSLRRLHEEGSAHQSVQRDAIDLTEKTLIHTEQLATQAAVELEDTRRVLTATQSALRKCEAQLVATERERQSLESELQQCNSAVDSWQGRCEQMQQRLVQFEAEHGAATSSYEASVSRLQEALGNCQQQIESQNAVLSVRRSHESTLLDERSQLANEVEGLETTVGAAAQQLQAVKAKLFASEALAAELREEVQRMKVIHAAERQDWQELSSAVARGQSLQIEELTHQQQVLVQRMMELEGTNATLEERARQLQSALALRVDEVRFFETALQKESAKAQQLAAVAREKEYVVEQLRCAHDTIAAEASKNEALDDSLQKANRRLKILSDKVKFQESVVAEARRSEEQIERQKVKFEELREKLRTIESESAAKKESLRAALDDRAAHLATIQSLSAEVQDCKVKLRELMKASDDKNRSYQMKVEQTHAAMEQMTGASRDKLAAMEKAEEGFIKAVSSDITFLLRYVFDRSEAVDTKHRKSVKSLEAVINEISSKYEADVTRLQDGIADARWRCHEAEQNQRVLVDQVRQLADAKRTLEDEVQKATKSGKAMAASVALSASRSLAERDGCAASRNHCGTYVLPLNVSTEVRETCDNISRDILGMNGGFDALIRLQFEGGEMHPLDTLPREASPRGDASQCQPVAAFDTRRRSSSQAAPFSDAHPERAETKIPMELSPLDLRSVSTRSPLSSRGAEGHDGRESVTRPHFDRIQQTLAEILRRRLRGGNISDKAKKKSKHTEVCDTPESADGVDSHHVVQWLFSSDSGHEDQSVPLQDFDFRNILVLVVTEVMRCLA